MNAHRSFAQPARAKETVSEVFSGEPNLIIHQRKLRQNLTSIARIGTAHVVSGKIMQVLI